MIKFNVIQDTIQLNKISDRKTIEEAIISSDNNNSIIGKYDTLEEAKDFAETKVKELFSSYKQGYVTSFVEIEYLMIEETEYDEDGEFVDSEIWDILFNMPDYKSEENEE